MCQTYPKIAQLKSVEEFRDRLAELQLDLPADDRTLSAEEGSPLAAACAWGPLSLGNRWCIHPMEGWDANRDGSPSELTKRRWQRFGASGAKLIWGGEAVAVQPDGRANPRQLLAHADAVDDLADLRAQLVAAHCDVCGSDEGLIVGLQLTHSGRFARPNGERLEPRIAYHHPLLDRKFGISPDDRSLVWTDDDLQRLIDKYLEAARVAWSAGYHFVDIKACHGYLLHEFLSARVRPGPFGGDFAGRTRLLRTIVQRVRSELPGLLVGVRLSVFDIVPYATSRDVGQPMDWDATQPYRWGFGVDQQNPQQPDLEEPLQLLGRLRDWGVVAVNLSCGSPYYNPHIQRPAIFPPSDGYSPPEDPLVGVVRQIQIARQCKMKFPELFMVGTGYSYLQDYLVQVAQAVVRQRWIDAVGIGRMVLSYPGMPVDSLAGRPPARKLICRTFSDCTTAPRHGFVSGCYPLDGFYKQMPEANRVAEIKRDRRD